MKTLKTVAALCMVGLVSVAHADFGHDRYDHDGGYGQWREHGDHDRDRGGRDRYTDWARVTRVTPQYERVQVPQRQCTREYIGGEGAVYRRADGHSAGGAVIGGLAGGILGNQVGAGSGRVAATAVGAVVGALVGDHLGGGYRSVDYAPRGREIERCREVGRWERRLVGYQVEYVYEGRRYSRFMNERPGNRVPVQVAVRPR